MNHHQLLPPKYLKWYLLLHPSPPLPLPQCVSGMLDMLGEEDDSPAMSGEARATASTFTAEDPDDVLTGGGREGGGVDDGGGGGRRDARRGRYAELLPHLLDLVAYQSGVDAVEVMGVSWVCT